MKKKLLAIVLAAAMVFTLLPVVALAADYPLTVTGGTDQGDNPDYQWIEDEENGGYQLMIYSTGLTLSGGTKDAPANVHITVGEGGRDVGLPITLTLNGVYIENWQPLRVRQVSEFTLTLAEGSVNTLNVPQIDDSLEMLFSYMSDATFDSIVFYNVLSATINGKGTLNLSGSISSDTGGEFFAENCEINIDSFIYGFNIPNTQVNLLRGTKLNVKAKPIVVEKPAEGWGEELEILFGEPDSVEASGSAFVSLRVYVSSSIDTVKLQGCNIRPDFPVIAGAMLVGDSGGAGALPLPVIYRLEDGVTVMGSADYDCDPETDELVPATVDAVWMAMDEDFNITISNEKNEDAIDTQLMGYSGFVNDGEGDVFAKTLVFKGVQPEVVDDDDDDDDGGETKPSIGIKLDIGKLISDIFGFIKFRRVEDGVKTFSIFTVIIEFVKSILAKI